MTQKIAAEKNFQVFIDIEFLLWALGRRYFRGLEQADYKHKPALPNKFYELTNPIYKELTNEDLVTRCIDSYTQNSNKSLQRDCMVIIPEIHFEW